jgi:hypothetical protein
MVRKGALQAWTLYIWTDLIEVDIHAFQLKI